MSNRIFPLLRYTPSELLLLATKKELTADDLIQLEFDGYFKISFHNKNGLTNKQFVKEMGELDSLFRNLALSVTGLLSHPKADRLYYYIHDKYSRNGMDVVINELEKLASALLE